MVRVVKEPEVRREEIVEVAKNLFFTKGYDKTSIRDIVKEVGGATGMFYHYFKSKDEIYNEIINSYIDEYSLRLSNILKSKELSIQDRLMMTLKAAKYTFKLLVFDSEIKLSVDDESFKTIIREKITQKLIPDVAGFIQELIDSGIVKKEKLKTDNLKGVAAFIMYGIYGLLNLDKKAEITIESSDKKFEEILILFSNVLGTSQDFIFGGSIDNGANKI